MKPTTKLRSTLTVVMFFGVAAFFSVEATTTPAPQPGICNRACWTARNGTCTTTIGSLSRAIIHHTAGPSDFTIDYAIAKVRVWGVQNYHMDNNGWCDIGYYFLVFNGGHIFEGRKNSMTGLPRGNHAGCGNNNSFGFTLMGYFHTPYNHNPSTAMQNALYDVIAWRMPSGWSPYGNRTSYPGSMNGTAAPLDTHAWVGASTSTGCAATACPGSVIINNYITSNFHGGPMRNGIATRRGGTTPGGNRVGIARSANGSGYWIAAADGGVFSFGNATFYGSMGGQPLNKPIVGIAARPQGNGYWLVASDGGIFSFGAAGFHGSTGGMNLNQPIVGMASTQSGNGYWLVAKDGGIFSFGDAPFHGSLGGAGYTDIVGMAPAYHANNGNGYWIVRQSGHIYSYNASYHGGGEAGSSVTSIVSNGGNNGYWQVRNNGAVYSYGSVCYQGGRNELAFVGIARGPSNCGYWLLKNDGAVYSFGDAVYYGGANF